MILVTLLSAMLAGCGSGYHPLRGKVVWADGSPATELVGAHVVFEHEASNTGARAILQPDATFEVTTDRPEDGAVPGQHKVVIIEVGRKMVSGSDSEIAPGFMDSKFSDFRTSGLTAEVKPGKNEITLTVERYVAPK